MPNRTPVTLLKSCYERFHLLIIVGLEAAVFLPMMGRGFITDDFPHLTAVTQSTFREGVLGIQGGPFYAPTAWLSYSLDWVLWGYNPFAFAAGNLLLHIANTLLLYFFARGLWRSHIAGWWAALGYALLFPANVSAVMFIATRAHLFVVFFCLAAMLSALWFARTEDRRVWAFLAIVAFVALAVFSKENGITAVVAITLVLLYERRSANPWKLPVAAVAGLFVALFAVVATYAVLRSRSGAVGLTFGCGGYRYCLSPSMIVEHLFQYGWRTYGLLAILALAIAASRALRGGRPRLHLLTWNDLLLSLPLFAVAAAPTLLLDLTTFIYTYVPGIGAALLLGATARSFYETPAEIRPRRATLAAVPVVLVVAAYLAIMVNHSLKWMRMAEVSTMVLNQIAAQQPKPAPHTFFIVTYPEKDRDRRFPECLSYCFVHALRVIYSDQTLEGLLRERGEPCAECNGSSVVHLSYHLDREGMPHVILDPAGYLRSNDSTPCDPPPCDLRPSDPEDGRKLKSATTGK